MSIKNVRIVAILRGHTILGSVEETYLDRLLSRRKTEDKFKRQGLEPMQTPQDGRRKTNLNGKDLNPCRPPPPPPPPLSLIHYQPPLGSRGSLTKLRALLNFDYASVDY